ncbi:carbohydrate kinase family protein [Candidatus Woesearchaeota archaeon]|nr:MAG: carbohydrate kinase family protein [Candidatus Woesearchaeota archaeon]
MFDVITVGSATIDAFVKTKSDLITIQTPSSQEELIAYPSGTKILITDLQFMVGGGGTNTAVSLARLGHKVAYLGRLGNDENAKLVLKLLKKEKVKFIGSIGKTQTGFSVILDSIKHDRTILTYKGAIDNFSFDQIDTKKLKTKWFYCSALMGKSFAALKKIAKYAAKNKIKLMFNPSSYLAEKGPEFLKDILISTDVLVLNKEEAQYLVGKKTGIELVEALRSLGPKIAVVTDGHNPTTASDGMYYYTLKPSKVRILETTGAGDAFASTLLSGILRKNDLATCLKMAQTNSESVIQHYGAKNKLLSYRELMIAMKKTKANVKKRRL